MQWGKGEKKISFFLSCTNYDHEIARWRESLQKVKFNIQTTTQGPKRLNGNISTNKRSEISSQCVVQRPCAKATDA